MNEVEFENEAGVTAKEVMKKLGCSRSLLSTPEMKIALGAFVIGKSGIRFKKSYVKRMMEGETLIALLEEQMQATTSHSIEGMAESKLGLW
ncbi:MAG: hypothetical protein CVU60_12440 [Deltaproteobacteria bacterium HGW-Deltaproteobacteria-18]|jgi:hypothetical protein|nr:MAG: hypothetical protein CVU60_12440 [Deltaproteobacteria bacterium HGW-Deltaproteobacteria-18]